MPYERRGFNRAAVNWPGHVKLDDGRPVDVRVVDLSDSGARVLMPLGPSAQRHDLLDLAAWQPNFWPLRRNKRVDVRGRVVRVVRHGDCPFAEVGLRFLSPLRQAKSLLDFQWLRQFAQNMVAAPCA